MYNIDSVHINCNTKGPFCTYFHPYDTAITNLYNLFFHFVATQICTIV
jgi:hypothetical protein